MNLLVRSRLVSWGTLVLFGLAALQLSWIGFRWGGESYQALIGNALTFLPSLVAAPLALTMAFKYHGEARRGWLFIGLGVTAQAVGNGFWSYFELVGADPFPSIADVFYLLFGPLFALGLWQLTPTLRDRLEGVRLGLDVMITVGAAGLFFWRFLLAPPLAWGVDVWTTGVTLAYPLLDLLLLSLLLVLVLREPLGEAPRPGLLFLGLGFSTQIAGDILYNVVSARGDYSTGHPVDALWTASTVLFVVAARVGLAPRNSREKRGEPTRTFNGLLAVGTPYVALAAGMGLLIVTQRDPAVRDTLDGQGVFYGTMAVTVLVVLRQLFAFLENWRLANDLRRQSAELKALSETLETKVGARTAELAALSRRYRHDALHDALTGLPNRTHFLQQLKEADEHARPFAALYLDFDRFKAVNDSLGHAVGDALLIAIGERLGASVRPGDLVARLGGDEFAVLLEGVNSAEDAPPAAERLTRAFTLPLQVSDHTVHITASIGVVTGGGNRGGAEDVLSDADIAMYRAKASGGSRHVVFEPTMREATQARLALEGDLRRALEHEEFEAYYQPVIHTESGKISGFEALVRWRHPERGLVAPADFVPVAEETGLIIELDRWVLRRACEQLAAWSALNPDLSLSVNLSSRQFARTDLAPFIAGVLAKTGFEPQRLKLELTESLLMDASTPVGGTLAALRQLGVRLHIDDFGTGYSSLSYLQRFDADVLKVDRSFVTKMLESEDSAELVRTIINMAHNLGMQVVAEGVESKEQFARLRALGCEYAQGYLFSKPVPAAVAEDFLRPEAVAVVA